MVFPGGRIDPGDLALAETLIVEVGGGDAEDLAASAEAGASATFSTIVAKCGSPDGFPDDALSSVASIPGVFAAWRTKENETDSITLVGPADCTAECLAVVSLFPTADLNW